MYEIQNRSVEEHEAFSFQIERENLKWLWNANQDFHKEMLRQNSLDDFESHYNLKGAIFQRKWQSMCGLTGMGYFGLAAMSYMHFPMIAAHLGSSLTSVGVAGALVAGMSKMQESNVVNSISFVNDDSEHQGKLKFNISTGPLGTSKDIYADVKDCSATFSIGEDNLETEANLVQLKSYIDSNGQTVENSTEGFVLPA